MNIFILNIFGCASTTTETFSMKNYNNPKPNKELRESYILEHPELTSRIRGLIRNGLIDVGMSKEEVLASWGKPDSKKETSKYDADEMWYYWDNPKFHRYIYFKDDVVVKAE